MGGWADADFDKPVITVAAPYTNASSCNHQFDQLAKAIADAVEEAGGNFLPCRKFATSAEVIIMSPVFQPTGKPYICYPPVITDGMTMGAEGMKYSLPSRDMIADHIELMHEGYRADAMITVGGCDKTQPGALMPIPRGNHFGITMYGGGRLSGDTAGDCPKWESAQKANGGEGHLDAGSIYEAQGSFAAGIIDIEELNTIEERCLGSTGTCGAMYTASTMAASFEAMGMALPGSSSHQAVRERAMPPGPGVITETKIQDCKDSVAALFSMMRAGLRSRDIMTMKSFENAITVIYALGKILLHAAINSARCGTIAKWILRRWLHQCGTPPACPSK